jgi:hypothetical protein
MILELLQSGISLPPVMARVFVILQTAQQASRQPEQVLNVLMMSK